MALVASLFLRWAGVLGPIAPLMATACCLLAVYVYQRQRRRHARAVAGVIRERLMADVWGIYLTSAAVVLLAIGGMLAVITGS